MGRGWYVAAGACALAGTAAAVALVVWLVQALGTDPQFLAPGRLSLAVEEPGKVVIWHDHRTLFQGVRYDAPEALPAGARIRAVEEASGRELAVGASMGASSESGASRRVAVAQFRAEQPGRYLIVVEGGFEPRVFSAGLDMLPRVLWTAAGAAALLFASWALAIGMVAWAFIRREARAPAQPASAAAASESLKTLVAVVYGLQLGGFLVPFTPLAGVILNYVKRAEARGTWLESHFTWQIRTFWWSLLWCAVGLALAIVIVGFFILLAAALWVLYRAIRGWVELADGKPAPL
ncbi:MAG TPA: hypothetical protein VF876_01950 [Burkholderiales bacterium]